MKSMLTRLSEARDLLTLTHGCVFSGDDAHTPHASSELKVYGNMEKLNEVNQLIDDLMASELQFQLKRKK